jgi:outer membrane protein OmpA-like peptidoglycan-associated protein
MRIPRILIAVLALLAVSGCTQQTAKSNYHDFRNWWAAKPSHMENRWGPINTGYFGQNAAGRAVLKPPGMEPLPPEAWHEIDSYDVAPLAPAPGMRPPVAYGESVSVYPLEEDANGVRPRYVIEQPRTEAMPAPMPMQESSVVVEPLAMGYGEMAAQIFFLHGSAHIGAGDRKQLASAARKVKKRNVSVTVVGHASHRVNTTDDPIRKKEINFEMAQKRANAVTNALISQGVEPGWVMAVSKGDDEPNMHRGKRSQEAADRRAEVFMNGQ